VRCRLRLTQAMLWSSHSRSRCSQSIQMPPNSTILSGLHHE
jgi:hypothetical protein